MKRRLVVANNLIPICVIIQTDDNKLVLKSCDEMVRPDIERWISQGFTQSMGKMGHRRLIVIDPSDSDFLEKICNRFNQYNLKTLIIIED